MPQSVSITATAAKNRFGQLLEQAQRKPVIIEKAGRRHSVLMSVQQYETLLAGQQPAPATRAARASSSPEGRAFYARYKDWVDMQNELVEQYGVFGEEYRVW